MTCWAGLTGDKVSMPSFLNRLIHISSHEKNQYQYKLKLMSKSQPHGRHLHRAGSLVNRDGLGLGTVHSSVTPSLSSEMFYCFQGPELQEWIWSKIHNVQQDALAYSNLATREISLTLVSLFALLHCLKGSAELLSVSSCPLLALTGSIPPSRLHLALMALCVFGSPLSSLQLKKKTLYNNCHHLSHSKWLPVIASEYENMVII